MSRGGAHGGGRGDGAALRHPRRARGETSVGMGTHAGFQVVHAWRVDGAWRFLVSRRSASRRL